MTAATESPTLFTDEPSDWEDPEYDRAQRPTTRREPTRREYACAYCGRRLPHERWVYSAHTASRYCTPGEGCQTPAAYARQERALARSRKEA